MDRDSPSEPYQSTEPHYFTPDERVGQLAEFRDVTTELVSILEGHGDGDWATSEFAQLARRLSVRASELLETAHDQRALSALGSAYTDYPVDWLDPRAPAYQVRRETWINQVRELHAHASRVALSLRSVAEW